MPVCQRCLRRCPAQCDRARGAQLHWDPRMLWRWDHRSLRRGQTRGWQQDLASGLLVGLGSGQKRMWQTKGRGKVTKTWAKHEGGACASRILRDRLILELPEKRCHYNFMSARQGQARNSSEVAPESIT